MKDIVFDSTELWIYYEFDEDFKLLEFVIKISNQDSILSESFIRAICHILYSNDEWKYMNIIFTNNFDFPKTFDVKFFKSTSEIKHKLKEVTIKVDFDFCNDQEIQNILYKHITQTLMFVCELRVSELILNGFSNSLLASLLSGYSLFIENICFLRIEDLQDKPLQLDLDGGWTENLIALVSWYVTV